MAIPISGITHLSSPAHITPPASKPSSGEFQEILSGAINRVENLNHRASDAIQKFMSGENQELHTTALAAQEAGLAFSLGLQVRNKVVDAYQEIMKMQI